MTELDVTTRYLNDLPTLIDQLHTELVRATRPPGRGNKPTSRPPANLGTISDIDQTWRWTGIQVDTWCDAMNLKGPQPTWHAAYTWLANHWPNMTNHDAAPDFRDELKEHHRRLTYHLPNQRTWLPLPGTPTCPIVWPESGRCGGKLLEHQVEKYVECRDTMDGKGSVKTPGCGERWPRASYDRLAQLLGVDPQPVPIAQAAKHAEIPIRTLRDWIARGWITPTSSAPAKVMYADVVTLQTRIREGI